MSCVIPSFAQCPCLVKTHDTFVVGLSVGGAFMLWLWTMMAWAAVAVDLVLAFDGKGETSAFVTLWQPNPLIFHTRSFGSKNGLGSDVWRGSMARRASCWAEVVPYAFYRYRLTPGRVG